MEKTSGCNYSLIENSPSRKANSSTASIALSETQGKRTPDYLWSFGHHPPKAQPRQGRAWGFMQIRTIIKFAPLLLWDPCLLHYQILHISCLSTRVRKAWVNTVQWGEPLCSESHRRRVWQYSRESENIGYKSLHICEGYQLERRVRNQPVSRGKRNVKPGIIWQKA